MIGRSCSSIIISKQWIQNTEGICVLTNIITKSKSINHDHDNSNENNEIQRDIFVMLNIDNDFIA